MSNSIIECVTSNIYLRSFVIRPEAFRNSFEPEILRTGAQSYGFTLEPHTDDVRGKYYYEVYHTITLGNKPKFDMLVTVSTQFVLRLSKDISKQNPIPLKGLYTSIIESSAHTRAFTVYLPGNCGIGGVILSAPPFESFLGSLKEMQDEFLKTHG